MVENGVMYQMSDYISRASQLDLDILVYLFTFMSQYVNEDVQFDPSAAFLDQYFVLAEAEEQVFFETLPKFVQVQGFR